LVRFSVAVPIHNEEKFLPYTLPSIFRLDPNEVILIFDRCTDKSIPISRKISEHINYKGVIKFIEVNNPSPEWASRIAFLRMYAFKLASNDIILNTDADIILDPKIKDYLKLIGKNNIGLISFSRKEYPFTFQNFVSNLISAIIPTIGFAGTYAFSKKALHETINEKFMKQIHSAEDTYIHIMISKKYKTKFIRTNNIHLRPREDKKRHYSKGVSRWWIKHDPLWRVFLHSLVYLRPMVFVGYMHARRNTIGERQFYLNDNMKIT